MTAQIANGGYKIKPRIIDDKYQLASTISEWRDEFENKKSNLIKLFENQENVKFLHDALYGATNEPMGTSYRSRNTKKGFTFAGKTGTSQIRTITEEERELKITNEDLPYEKRDHSLFVGFAPYKNPRYAISVVIEHGGSGSSVAAPIAKKVLNKVIERHELRKKFQLDLFRDTQI